MRFYRVHYGIEHGNSAGYGWFTSCREADTKAKAWIDENPDELAEVRIIEIKPTKAGILSALSLYASHPDNG